MPSGNTLPPELVSLCLSHLDPTDRATVRTLCSCSLVSSSFRALATANSLWKPIADAHYHQYRSPLPSRLEEYERDAFGYFASRARKDHRATEIVKEIQRPTDRIPLIEELRNNSALGCEVIENPRWTESGEHAITEQNAPEDWLSLRHWAAECRKTLLRDEALRLWRDISIRSIAADDSDSDSDDEMTDLERGLDAFSAFRGLDPARLARDRYGMSNHPRLLEATADPPPHFTGARLLEWLATQVVDYMKSIGIGPAREGGFHSLDNHYVELVWRRAAAAPDGPQNEGTLPMTLVHIFCALVRRLPVARRFGIRAQMIGYPGTVLAGLSYRRRGGDGGGGGGGGQEEDRNRERDRARIYINVFGEGKILSPERLRAMLGAMGQADSEQDFLAPASAREMCLRVARNILTSVRAGDRTIGVPIQHELSVEALYSVSHALFLFTSPHALLDRDRRQEDVPTAAAAVGADTLQYAEWLESLVQSEYPLDVSYLSGSVLPLLPSPDRQARLRTLCTAIRDEDATPREPKVVNAEIKWPIGHVFRHRLFGYLAITRGFDYRCEAGEQWIRQMRVDTLPYGRHQPFYHVVVEDGSARYVAQENITDASQYTVSDAEVDSFLEQESLGRYFRCRKRVQPGTGAGAGRWVFLPSEQVAAEYPESGP
ncbi:hypothetical protein RHOSPDRAFT_29218 [Rhodotorula sp. JG-1b]|nr:hypothetical protein RHOSPDRAFT_29218 [Rhodotorula sp. JG-1b]